MVQAVNALRRARSTYLYVMQVMFFAFVCLLAGLSLGRITEKDTDSFF